MSKKYSFAILGFLIGLVFGVLAALGESNYYKKSQRNIALPILSIGGGLIFSVISASVGYKVGKTIDIENATGISDADTQYYKIGRFWTGITKWTDPRNEEVYKCRLPIFSTVQK